jgi:hypothetical protein
MSHVIIDRRKNDKGKSSVNRRKFIGRVKGILKDSVKDIVRDGGLKDLASSKGKKVRVPVRDLDEPNFHHDKTGINDIVRPGNDKFVPGDKLKRPPNSGSGPGGAKGSEDGEGEDEFTFHLTKEEFLEIFFDNCALPDLVKENLAVLTEEVMQRHGFTSDGSPSMLNVMRSMRGAVGRRSGLRALKGKKLKELERKEAELLVDIAHRKANNQDVSIEVDALEKLQHQIEVMKRRIKAVPFIDPIDLKFNNWTRVQVPKVQAVMVCLMDVSGSMDERKKELAKTFYLLLYLFLMQEYEHIEIVYVTYHTRAQVVTEQDFYYGHETGGTVTSRGLEAAYDEIMLHYSPELWNIYLAHSSDGDNFPHDNEIVKDFVLTKMLPILQYYAYVQINPDDEQRLSFSDDDDSLWSIFKPMSEVQQHLSAAVITSEESVYPVFIKLFERKS